MIEKLDYNITNEEDRYRLEGALCNSGYVERLEEARAEIQTFTNSIRNQTLDEVEAIIHNEPITNDYIDQMLCRILRKIAEMREGKKWQQSDN